MEAIVDPLKPIFKAQGWDLEEKTDIYLRFRRNDDESLAICEVYADKFSEGDLCFEVTVAASKRLKTAASDETMYRRLGWLQAAAREYLENDGFSKRMLVGWFPEVESASVSLSNLWPGHGFMLVAPYELYIAAVGDAYERQKDILERVMPSVKLLLERPEDDSWADDYMTYRRLLAGPDSTMPANTNRPLHNREPNPAEGR